MVDLDASARLVRRITAKPEEGPIGIRPAEGSPNNQSPCETSERDALHAGLAIAASEGDHAAFAALVNRHKNWIYRYLTRHTDNEEDARDALQDVFLSAWRYLGRYDPRRSFKIWLSQIVLNKSRDRWRRSLVRRTTLESLSTIERIVRSSTASPETVLIRDQALLRIEAAIEELPPQYKESLVLTVIDDLSHSQAAAQLGITRKVLENRVGRAKERLASMLRASDLRDLVGEDTSRVGL